MGGHYTPVELFVLFVEKGEGREGGKDERSMRGSVRVEEKGMEKSDMAMRGEIQTE